MKDVLKNKIFEIISNIAEELDEDIYVIGGFVRDNILKRESKDIDIVVIGNGINLAKKIQKHLKEDCKLSIFKNFGTAMLLFEDMEVEIVGARKESYRTDSRKPIVENGSLEDDQKRRDFTINAMAISLNKKTYGKFIDPFNGIEDLKRKTIRTPLDAEITFSD
ncbi:MAG: tRNA nucleotidyltransferase, partial [Bacteroidales bacterium]|nr:tRNA nucleotidyltransferase [Bacteroidales bacterium]MBN2755993.1 tRNA nucleotidyltransferase [Bacteroidales bacterium]